MHTRTLGCYTLSWMEGEHKTTGTIVQKYIKYTLLYGPCIVCCVFCVSQRSRPDITLFLFLVVLFRSYSPENVEVKNASLLFCSDVTPLVWHMQRGAKYTEKLESGCFVLHSLLPCHFNQ